MAIQTIHFARIDIRHADDATYAAFDRFVNLMQAEAQPDDPPVSLAEHRQGWTHIPEFIGLETWTARTSEEGPIIASADLIFPHTPENQHLGQINLGVLPAYRRQGIGRQLLRRICDAAIREQRQMLIADTSERVPAGEAFALSLGAKAGMHSHVNQLKIAELDRGLLHAWLERGSAQAEHFELQFWSGPYPEDQIGKMAKLYEVMNQAPHGDLAVEEQHFTPALLRQIEQSALAAGNQRWTLVVRERGTGALAGFTEVLWNPQRSTILSQADTGVDPCYRNRGLGRWLKAAMLQKVLAELPQVQYVRTANADSNAPMLKINAELGFKPYISRCIWQLDTAQLQESLAKRLLGV